MSSNLKVTLTKAQVENCLQLYHTGINMSRTALLIMFEGDAHKPTGYANFADFAKERMNLDVSDRTIQYQMQAARVERNVFGMFELQEITTDNLPKIPTLPIRVSSELAKLPTPELQKEAYEQMQTLRDYGYRTEADVLRGLKNLVKQKLNGQSAVIEPAKTETPAAPVQEEKKPDFFQQPVSEPRNIAIEQIKSGEDVTPEAGSLEWEAERRQLNTAKPKPPVTSFTPAPDFEPGEDEKPDFEGWTDALNTALVYMQSQEVTDDRRTRLLIAADLNAVAAWIEKG